MSTAFGFSERFDRLLGVNSLLQLHTSREVAKTVLVSLITLFAVISASHSYDDHRLAIKCLTLQGAEKTVFGGQNQTVTECAVEINFSLTKAAISNEHCATFEAAFCLILRRLGYRLLNSRDKKSQVPIRLRSGQALRFAPPDFLSRPVDLTICIRLSLRRAAHVAVASSASRKSGFAPVRKQSYKLQTLCGWPRSRF
jgi:hypothetical protein